MKRIKGKKAAVLCTALALSINMMTYTAYAEDGETETDFSGVNKNFVSSVYTNSQNIIISQPSDGYITTSSRVSILGAADWNYPIYMNEKEIETTELGFFAQYVDLSLGNNTFTFTNNGKSKSITIVRQVSGSSGSGSGASSRGITYWSENHAAKYAVVKGNNISRMSKPGADSSSLMMPLASGTVAQIIGEAGNLYCLCDYSFVYKSNVTVKDGTLGRNTITGMNFVEDNGYDCTEIQLSMGQKALYNFEMGQDSGVLTIYNTNQVAWTDIPQNRMIKNVEILENGSKGYVKYLISFQKNAPINGYYVEFAEGKMLVGLKKLPTITDDSLQMVRIHIDAGHGGSDIGAKGPMDVYGPLEKDINLGIALYAKAYLESKEATVIMTRTGDTAEELSERAARVAALKPDFSLSVHCNSMPVTANYNNAKGFLTFYSFNNNDAPEFINTYITNRVGIQKSSARYSNLAMTRMTGYPAVLFETSFMSNPSDYEWMIKPETQKLFGVAAGEAVETYIKQITEKNINTYV
ncbi:N-acetylmuramoyl-L-alanine amidase family protein [Aminipila sp.]|uniref:N-acetylmuramoyl-L-alanine amidase family protein n=1 Tax=Aminipila sp. TaxID=2060095 RepID=UPI0028A2C9CB|nr:N-acetylmuramoyl-L-alanine amidase [Aminipila sp.]